MAIDDRTIAIVYGLRSELDRYLAAVEHDLAIGWATAWHEISSEFDAAARELNALGAGEWPTRAQINRSQRAINAMKATSEALSELAKQAGIRMTGDLRTVIDSVEHWQSRIVGAQLPEFGVTVDWARVDAKALDAIVRRTTRRIESTLRPLPGEVQARMKAVLIRGVATGDNPNQVASQIVRRAGDAFDGGLRRARNIARTELLDAGRTAAQQSRMKNRDVLSGWRWLCALSARTCPSCLAQNGSLHDLAEPGPHDHQSGRCTAVPVARPWKDLGIALDEPADTFPDAKAWFHSQDEGTQRHIMGDQRLKALKSGRIGWDDMSQRIDNPGWRSSYRVRPLN